MTIIVKRSDSLVHKRGEEREDHKYIKREWKNGKWKYWYKTAKNKVKEAVEDKIDDAADKLGVDERKALKRKEKILDHQTAEKEQSEFAKKQANIRLKWNSDSEEVRKEYNKAAEKDVQTSIKLKVTEEQVKQLVEEYAGTPLGKIENAINSGVKFVEDIFGITADKEWDEWEKEKDKSRALDDLEDEERAKAEERERLKEEEERRRREAEFQEKEKERLSQEEREKAEVLDDFSDLARKDRSYTPEEDQAAVNPYYYTDNYAYTHNCAYCTAAYDLRRRGYDVEASAKDPENDGETYLSELEKWYEGETVVALGDLMAKYNNGSSLDAETATECLVKDLLEHGDGARGFLNVYWSQGGAHAVVWEVEDGEVVIRDCQTNTAYDDPYDLIKRTKRFNYFRTDNVEPTDEVLELVRNKKDVHEDNNTSDNGKRR